ncbi:response regulator transcription factor [Reyranella soli]|uniref:DNA-binding response regulator n=1 Tax=Reyranella soli TaxID=1230389 RepID=A0A512NMV3_9HYPH|nr:response regulator transcription factor [Reyranella soli]GEP60252.1 DNA-binding response regulator [Reyranella soli]
MLVDDDDLYLEAMMGELEDRGFAVRGFLDGPSLLKELEHRYRADALLLDWTLPTMSGIDVLSGVRERGIDVPIAFLTGRALVDHEHIALKRGAIDFIDKMRGADVIARRLHRMLRSPRSAPVTAEPEAPRVWGSLSLWQRSARIEWRGTDVGLTLTEYKIIALLVANVGKPLTYRAIYDAMHYAGFMAGFGTDGYLVNVRSALRRIRKKFLTLDPAFVEIENHEGVGYCWRR